MALFDKNSYGKLSSQELSNYILENTSPKHRALAAMEANVSLSTVDKVARRDNEVSEKSSNALVELMRLAIENCTQEIIKRKQAKRYFESKLKKLTA